MVWVLICLWIALFVTFAMVQFSILPFLQCDLGMQFLFFLSQIKLNGAKYLKFNPPSIREIGMYLITIAVSRNFVYLLFLNTTKHEMHLELFISTCKTRPLTSIRIIFLTSCYCYVIIVTRTSFEFIELILNSNKRSFNG